MSAEELHAQSLAKLHARFEEMVRDTHSPFALARIADGAGYADIDTARAFTMFQAGYWIGRTDGADEAIAAIKRLTA